MSAAVPDKLITSYGYSLSKTSVTPEKLASIKSALMMAPKGMPNFQKTESFPIYAESRTRLYLPRAWAEEELGPADEDWLPKGIDLPSEVTPQGTPYDYQETIINTIIRLTFIYIFR